MAEKFLKKFFHKSFPPTYLPTHPPTYLPTHLPTYSPTYLSSIAAEDYNFSVKIVVEKNENKQKEGHSKNVIWRKFANA